MIKLIVRAGLMAVSLLGASVASAATISISISENRNSQLDFWTYSTNFVLPAGATGVTLSINQFAADDRSVMSLNGNAVASTGIYGPGSGSFVFTSGGANTPYVFQYGNGGPFTSITSGFVTGSNTLSFVVNDTWNGIYDDLSLRTYGYVGPTSLAFEGVVSYNVSGVPEPSTWALMLLGLAGLGYLGMARRRTVTAV